VLNVTNHTTHSIAADPCAGSYLVGYLVGGNVTQQGSVVEVDGVGSIQAIYRAGVPTYFVGFITEPSGCGNIVFNGTAYLGAQYVDVSPNTVVPIGTIPCAGYGWVSWLVSGGITIFDGRAYINQSGAIEAFFHPLVSVLLQTSPASCGGVNLSGVVYTNGKTALKPEGNSYSLTPVPCAYHVLSAWITSNGAVVANGTLTLSGASILTAVYVPAVYDVTLLVQSGGCGGVELGGVTYTNNSTVHLTQGPYNITPVLCAGYELSQWAVSGPLTANATAVVVNGSGSLTLVGRAVPPTLTTAFPATAPAGSSFLLRVKVAVLVPPYDYNYTWQFGDGTTATTSANFTSHTYATPGTYTVKVTVVDPQGRSANATGTVTVVASNLGGSFGLSTAGEIVLVAVAALLVVAVLAALLVRRRNAARAPPPEPTVPGYGPDETYDEGPGPGGPA
jgi:PKD domain